MENEKTNETETVTDTEATDAVTKTEPVEATEDAAETVEEKGFDFAETVNRIEQGPEPDALDPMTIKKNTMSVLARTRGEDLRETIGETQAKVERADPETNEPFIATETCDIVLVAHQDGEFSTELFAKDGVRATAIE